MITILVTHMRRMLISFGTPAAGTQFKRAHQGWIFQPPTPWILGPRPRYLVSETQKVQTEMVLGASNLVTWSILILATIWLVLFPMGSLVLLGVPSDWSDRLLVFILFCLLVPVLQNFCVFFALRALLKGSPRATEQITLAERLDAVAATFSIGVLITYLVLSLSLFLFNAYIVLVAGTWDALSFLGVAVVGWFVIWVGALLRAKLVSSGRTRTPEPDVA